ncbi:MAG TPA: peptidylprolyl isomerase [Planctomycetota bacterium]
MTLAALLLLLPCPQTAGAVPAQDQGILIDRMLAIVNDQVITLYMVEGEARHRQVGQAAPNSSLPELRKSAFRDLLVDALFREGFRISGMEPTFVNRIVDDIVEDRIEKAGSMAEYTSSLQQQGRSLEEEIQAIRRYYMAVYFQWVELGSAPAKGQKGYKADRFVGPAEIARYYQEHRDEFRRERRVQARMIQLRDEVGKAAAGQRIRDLTQRIRRGDVAFADAARVESSFRPSTGGSMGWVGQDTSYAKPIMDFLAGASADAISEPIQLQNALGDGELWVLLQVEAVQQAGMVPYDEAQIAIAAQLSRSNANNILAGAVNALRQRCYVWGPDAAQILDEAFVTEADSAGPR